MMPSNQQGAIKFIMVAKCERQSRHLSHSFADCSAEVKRYDGVNDFILEQRSDLLSEKIHLESDNQHE